MSITGKFKGRLRLLGVAATAKGNRWGHPILLGYRHGLRASELVALRWDDIDFRTSKLHVRRAKGGTASVHPLRAKELRALRRLLREMPEGQRATYLFVSERMAPLSVAGYQRVVARAGQAAGFGFLVDRRPAARDAAGGGKADRGAGVLLPPLLSSGCLAIW